MLVTKPDSQQDSHVGFLWGGGEREKKRKITHLIAWRKGRVHSAAFPPLPGCSTKLNKTLKIFTETHLLSDICFVLFCFP